MTTPMSCLSSVDKRLIRNLCLVVGCGVVHRDDAGGGGGGGGGVTAFFNAGSASSIVGRRI